MRSIIVIAVVLALIGAACGASSDVPDDQIGVALALVEDVPETTVAATTTVPVDDAPNGPESTTTSTIAPDPYRTWVATALPHVTRLAARMEPDGIPIPLPFAVPNPHQFGGPLTLMVTEGQPGDAWVKVQLPIRPNAQEGWINMDDYELSSTRVRAEVVLSETSVRVYDGEELIAETQAVIGAEDTPTPLGTFYVAAKKLNSQEESFLGSWAIVLSSFSETLPTFSGGLPVIAVHGTDRVDQLGEAISFGCVRVPNDVIEFLAENVPLGAPVNISA